jgi:hypothetical protein
MIVVVESDWVFQVEDLLTRATQTVHASRLKFYHDSSLHVTESLLEHVAHQQNGYEVSSLKDLLWSSFHVRYEVLVNWLGFEPMEDTWGPLSTVLEDAPYLVHRLLLRLPDQVLARKAREYFCFRFSRHVH